MEFSWPLLVSSIQSPSRVWLFATPWTAACQASLSVTNSQSSPKLMSVELVMPSNHLILCRPLLLLHSIFPSTRVFSNESALCIRWPKYWSFSFNISPYNEHQGLISFRMDWLNLLAVSGTLKSLLQYHGSKASILQHSAFFTIQLSHPYMTTGKTIALTRWTFVGKQTSLLFNMLSRLVITSQEWASFNFLAAITICSDGHKMWNQDEMWWHDVKDADMIFGRVACLQGSSFCLFLSLSGFCQQEHLRVLSLTESFEMKAVWISHLSSGWSTDQGYSRDSTNICGRKEWEGGGRKAGHGKNQDGLSFPSISDDKKFRWPWWWFGIVVLESG